MAVELILASLAQKPKRVLEIGARAAVNQEELSNLRALIPNASYVGVDMQAGPGVDLVADATALPFDNASFDLVLCLETLEHAREPWRMCAEITRVVKKKGAVILSSQQNFPIHLHPSDYFRYTPYGLASLLPERWEKVVLGISPPFDQEVELNPKHVIAVGWGGAQWEKRKLKATLKRGESMISGHKPYRHRLQEAGRILKRAFNELYFRQSVKFFEQ